MGLALTLARRGLSQRPARALFSVLGIAVGIATAVGVFVLDHNTLVGLSQRAEPDWRPAFEVRPSERVDAPEQDLAGLPGVAAVSAFFENEVRVRALGAPPDDAPRGARDGQGVRARLVALDSARLAALDAAPVAAGRSLDPRATEREVLVGEPLAERLGLAPGDPLLLARPARAARQECVDGELRVVGDAPVDLPPQVEFTVVGILAREKLGRRSLGEICLVDYGWGRELYQGVHVEPRYWVSHDPAVDLERLQSSLGHRYSYDLNKYVVVGQAADERAFRQGVRMAGFLALALGLYVIFHTLSMSITERVREVATLDALGATREQIARGFLTEASAIALAAGALGLAGGVGLAAWLLSKGVTTLGTGRDIQVFEVPWGTVAPLTLLGVGVALCGSVFPLLRARSAGTVAALRGEDGSRRGGAPRGFHAFAAFLLVVALPALYFLIVPVVGEAQATLVGVVLLAVLLLGLIVALPLLVPSLLGFVCTRLARPFERLSPLAGRLAARTMAQSPTRIAVSTASLALVAASFVGLKGMTASLRGEITQWAQEGALDKVWVRGLSNVPMQEVRAALAPVPGVLGVENGSVRTFGSFLLLGQRATDLAGYGPLAEDPSLVGAFEAGEGAILSRRLARNLDYRVGDRVQVGGAGGRVRELRVLAVSDAYGYFPNPDERLYAVVSSGFMRDAFCLPSDRTSEVAVRLGPGADLGSVEAALRAAFPAAERFGTVTGHELLDAHHRDLNGDFMLFDVILGLTALLAAMGVLNGQLLAALERSKELGVLKALGTTGDQLAGTVLLESLVVGLLGGVLGAALGAAATPLVVGVLEVLSGLAMPRETAGVWLLWVPAGAVALTLVAGLYPVWRTSRTDPVRAVRTG